MSADEQEIRQLVTRWMEATKAGDTAAVLNLMAEDVVFLVTGQPPMIGKEAFAAAMRGMSAQGPPVFDGKSEVQEVQIFGDRAWMWTKLTVVVTPPDGASPVTRAGHTLSVLKKQDGKWALARDANMLAPVQAK